MNASFVLRTWCKHFVRIDHLILPAAPWRSFCSAGTLTLQVQCRKCREGHLLVLCPENRLGFEHEQSGIWSHTHHHSTWLCLRGWLIFWSNSDVTYYILVWMFSLRLLWCGLLKYYVFQISVHSVLPWLWSSINKEFSFEKNSQVKRFFLVFLFF